MPTAASILESAGKLVGGDRQNTHGDKVQNHMAIARLWNGYVENLVEAGRDPRTLGAEDVANLMELLKVARRQNGAYNPDDYVDGAGYAAVAGECAARGAE
jgi:hypothetical protein